MSTTITVDTIIDASPERVWQVLTDFPGHAVWNPFVTHISGDLSRGGRLRVSVRPEHGRGMTFRPRVVHVEPGRGFSWIGRFLVPGLFDGRHSFELQPRSDGRTLFRQSETFSGLFVLMTKGSLDGTRNGFQAMNEALAARCRHLG